MLDKSSLHFFELLKGCSELQGHNLDPSASMLVRNIKGLLLKQQAIFRLLAKAIVASLPVTKEVSAPRGVKVVISADNEAGDESPSPLEDGQADDLSNNRSSDHLPASGGHPIKIEKTHSDLTSCSNGHQPLQNGRSYETSAQEESNSTLKLDSKLSGARTKRKRKTRFSQEQLQMIFEEDEDEDGTAKAHDDDGGDFMAEDNAEPTVFGQCRFCEKSLTLAESSDHVKLIHPEKTEEYYKCPICGTMSMSMVFHVRKYHDPNRIECDVCKRPFQREESMKIHRKITHFPDDTDFVCNGKDGCGKRFVTESLLKSHLAANHKHKNPKNLVCDLCGIPYSKKMELQRHLTNIHGIGEKQYSCPQCEKRFASPLSLRNHLMTHQPVRNQTCTICLKSFHTRKLLNQHEICHKPPRHECKMCGKFFLYRSAGLGTHLKQVHGVDMQGNKLSSIETGEN